MRSVIEIFRAKISRWLALNDPYDSAWKGGIHAIMPRESHFLSCIQQQ